MEREFPLYITEKKLGRVQLTWDDLRLSVRAEASLEQEGLCKLWLVGRNGRGLLGTLVPEHGRLTLRRQISLGELVRAGAWPPEGISAALLWPFDPAHPFPRPDLFCFGQVEGGQLKLFFDGEGHPVFSYRR